MSLFRHCFRLRLIVEAVMGSSPTAYLRGTRVIVYDLMQLHDSSTRDDTESALSSEAETILDCCWSSLLMDSDWERWSNKTMKQIYRI